MIKDGKGLCVFSFGLATGVSWGLGMFILGLCAWLGNVGVPIVELTSSIYIGFSATLLGSLVGALWGFVDGFIGGFILAGIYNLVIRCQCPKSKCCDVERKNDAA